MRPSNKGKYMRYIIAHHEKETQKQMGKNLATSIKYVSELCIELGLHARTEEDYITEQIRLMASASAEEIAIAVENHPNYIVQLSRALGLQLRRDPALMASAFPRKAEAKKAGRPSILREAEVSDIRQELTKLRAQCKTEAEFQELLEAKKLMAEWSDVPTDADGNVIKKPRFKDKYDQRHVSDIVRQYLEGDDD
jgi:hypothetical protein